MSYTKAITDLLNKGTDILYTAKLFGGVNNLLKLSKSNHYLEALIQTKLGGVLHCSAENEDEVMVAFNLDFIILEIDEVDMDDMNHYYVIVNVIVREIYEKEKQKMLFEWLDDYLLDLGAEVASFNEASLNNKMIWVQVKQINGIEFKNESNVSDSEILEIIPDEYLV